MEASKPNDEVKLMTGDSLQFRDVKKVQSQAAKKSPRRQQSAI